MTLRVCLALLGFASCAGSASAQVAGDTRESVLSTYGRPASTAKRGNREIFLYPKGGRIEFVDGKVADVKGTLPAPAIVPAGSGATRTESAPAKAAAEPSLPAAAAVAPSKKAPPPKTPAPAPEAENNFNPAVAANDLAKHVESMDTAWGGSPVAAHEPSPLESIPLFLAGLVLRFGITVLALKLAFKYWEMDAFWKGTLAIAGIDLTLHATFELLGPVTGGFTTMTAVENGIPGLVLIYTVHRFCFNKRIQNAVVTAVAVKTIVTLLYIFIAVAALNAAFG